MTEKTPESTLTSPLIASRRRYDLNRVTCIARVMDLTFEGENRFYIAPAEGEESPCGDFFAWGDWHHANRNLSCSHGVADDHASDATYSFLNGGEWFSSRDRAIAAIYLWIQRELSSAVMDIWENDIS